MSHAVNDDYCGRSKVAYLLNLKLLSRKPVQNKPPGT